MQRFVKDQKEPPTPIDMSIDLPATTPSTEIEPKVTHVNLMNDGNVVVIINCKQDTKESAPNYGIFVSARCRPDLVKKVETITVKSDEEAKIFFAKALEAKQGHCAYNVFDETITSKQLEIHKRILCILVTPYVDPILTPRIRGTAWSETPEGPRPSTENAPSHQHKQHQTKEEQKSQIEPSLYRNLSATASWLLSFCCKRPSTENVSSSKNNMRIKRS